MLPEKLYSVYLKSGKICTDTRNIIPGSVFFALKGENFNGDHYVDQALENGCVAAVASTDCPSQDERVFKVDDSLNCLQDLALKHRESFSFPVLGITGSNGKTTSKELIRDVLRKKYNVHATKGNLNNHIGVPLTILSTPTDCNYAIIEMGANHQREIAALCEISNPKFGFITNIGKAHLEGFGGPEGVKKGKKELFDYIRSVDGLVFVNSSLPHLMEISEGIDRIVFGSAEDEDQFEVISADPSLNLKWTSGAKENIIESQLAGAYNAFNIAAAVVIGKHFGVSDKDIIDAIEAYTPENNRSQWYQGVQNKLIMDAYNANPTSMEAALRNLKQVGNEKALAIIGDMKELGEHSLDEHHRIIALIRDLGIEAVLIGRDFKDALKEADMTVYKETEQAYIALKEKEIKDRIILLKGSRSMGLERLKDLF